MPARPAEKKSYLPLRLMASFRSLAKSALSLVRLLQPSKKAKRWYAEQMYQWYYRQRDVYEVQIYGKKIVFSTEDRYSGRWFFPRYSDTIHEPKATKLLARVARGAEGIIDVGANLGWFSCVAARLSDGTVHAFELDRENLRRLNKNIELNGLQNVRANHLAVTDSEDGVSYWKTAGSAGVGFSFTEEGNDEQEQVRVRATTVDKYAEDHCSSVDLIKIDVDGAEQKVLEGGQWTIREFCPHILLEVHPSRLESTDTSVQNVLNTLPDTYRIFEVKNFRWGGELSRERFDTSAFDPDQVSMLYAEPPDDSLSGYAVPDRPLYEFP